MVPVSGEEDVNILRVSIRHEVGRGVVLAAQAASFGAVVVHLTPVPVRPVGLVVRPGHRAPALQAFIEAAQEGQKSSSKPTSPVMPV